MLEVGRSGLATSTLRVAAWNGVRLLVQLLWLVLLVRQLGAHDYGQFVGIASLGIAVGGFSSLGMGMRMYRDAAGGKRSLANGWALTIGAMAWSSGLLFALVFGLSLAVFAESDPVVLACLLLAEVVVAPMVTQVAFAYAGLGQMGRSAAVPSVLACARLLVLVLIPEDAGLRSLAAAHLVGSILGAGAVLVVSTRMLDLSWRPARSGWMELREGLAFSGLWASGLMLGSMDKTLVLKLGGELVAGHYAIGQRVGAMAATPVEALATAALPALFRDEGAAGRRTLLVHWLGLAAICYGIFAGLCIWWLMPLAPTLFGEDFAGISTIGPLIAVYVVLYCVRVLAGVILLGRGLVGWRFACEGASLATFAMAALGWLPDMGWVGAMMALLAMEALMVVLFWGRIAVRRREVNRAA